MTDINGWHRDTARWREEAGRQPQFVLLWIYIKCHIYGLAYGEPVDSQAIFDVIGDPTRRRVLALLVAEGELCVCELTAALNEIQPKVSRHLSVIREAGLVGARREGTWMFYQVTARLPRWQRDMLDAMRDGAVPELAADRARLRRMSGRPMRGVSPPVQRVIGNA